MHRDITVEMVWKGIKYSRTVRVEVETPLDRFMADVMCAATELRDDLVRFKKI